MIRVTKHSTLKEEPFFLFAYKEPLKPYEFSSLKPLHTTKIEIEV